MGFKNHAIKKLPNQADILSCITDQDIFEYYLGGISSKPISSPFREDKNPSFSVFFSSQYNKLLFKDFATGDTGDAFVFVMRLFGYQRITDAFMKIALDFNLTQYEIDNRYQTGITPTNNSYKKPLIIKKRERLNIKIKVRKWNYIDRDFWDKKYDMSIEFLGKCGVYPISHYFINGYTNVAANNAYAFLEEKDGIQTFKIYQPYAEKNKKWLNNNDYSTWELWNQLPIKGKELIITSSRKDAMIIKNLFPSGYITACSLQSENVSPKAKIVEEIRSRFKVVYILYDNDYDNPLNPGRIAGEKLSQKTGFNQIEINEVHKAKDISDFYEKYKAEKTRNLIRFMLSIRK